MDEPVTVIGPNPAMDFILEVPRFVQGEVMRSRSSHRMAGGKPTNVARTIRRLNHPARLVSPLSSGPEGDLIVSACRDLGIALDPTRVAGRTRTCVIVADPDHGSFSVINEPGPTLTPEEADRYRRSALDQCRPGALLVASGSVPPGLGDDLYARLARHARDVGSLLFVDASGEVLSGAMDAGAWAIKVNAEELLSATGASTLDQAIEQAIALGVTHVVVTMGPDGARYGGEAGSFRVNAAPITVANPIGAGDAFLAGLVMALHLGRDWHTAMREASAIGALSASQLSPDVGPDPHIGALVEQIAISAP